MTKLTKVQIPKNRPTPLTERLLRNSEVVISFKYLDKCDVACLDKLSKYSSKHKEERVFKQLQSFLYEAEKCKNVEEMISSFTSKNGSTISHQNDFVQRIIRSFVHNYPDEKGILSTKLVHVHTKRNGKQKMVIFGVNYQSIFYILGIDPQHAFTK